MPGGWRYKGDGYSIPPKGGLTSAQKLLDQLIDYRLQNGVPLGNPIKDIEDYICGQYPDFCHRDNHSPKTGKQDLSTGPTLMERVLIWAQSVMTKKKWDVMDKAEAERRASICKHCQFNTPYATGCQSCGSRAKMLSVQLRKGHKLEDSLDANLKACSLHGHECKAGVWLDKGLLPALKNEAPENCWLR